MSTPQVKWPLPPEPHKPAYGAFEGGAEDYTTALWHRGLYGVGDDSFGELGIGMLQNSKDRGRPYLNDEFTALINWGWWPLDDVRPTPVV